MDDIIRRVDTTFKNKRYLDRLNRSEKNWLGLDVADVLSGILTRLQVLK